MWGMLQKKKEVIAQIISGGEDLNDIDEDEVVELIMDEIIEEL